MIIPQHSIIMHEQSAIVFNGDSLWQYVKLTTMKECVTCFHCCTAMPACMHPNSRVFNSDRVLKHMCTNLWRMANTVAWNKLVSYFISSLIVWNCQCTNACLAPLFRAYVVAHWQVCLNVVHYHTHVTCSGKPWRETACVYMHVFLFNWLVLTGIW